MEEQEYDIEEEYDHLSKKYGLPDFDAMSQDFDIEKLYDKNTSYLAREIRRIINEKISAYLHLFETLLNPRGSPVFILKILSNISKSDKHSIQAIYKMLTEIQIQIMKLDTIYSEESEIQFIKKTFTEWQTLKQDIFGLCEMFETNFENNDKFESRTYFN